MLLKHLNTYRHSLLPKLVVYLEKGSRDIDTDKLMEGLRQKSIQRLDEKDLDASALKNIEDVSKGVLDNLQKSTGVISKKEQDHFLKEFERLSSQKGVNATHFQTLDRQITEVTTKSAEFKDAIKSTLKEVANASDQELEGELEKFNELDVKGKEKYVKDFEQRIAKLQGFLEKLKDKVKLNPKGIEATLNELETKNKLFEEYHGLLENNKEFIGGDDIVGQFELWFCMRPTVEDAKKAIKEFEPTQLKPRQEAVAKFKQFNPERQKEYADFLKVGLSDKEKILMEMELAMDKSYHTKLNDCKDVSEDTRIMLRAEYDKPNRSISSRENFLTMLEGYLKTEAALTARYDALPARTKARLENKFDNTYDKIIKPEMDRKGFKAEHRSKPKAFSQLTSDEKTILIQYIEDNKDKIDAENKLEEGMQKEYEQKVDIAMATKPHAILSKKTGEEFKEWFKQQLIEDESPNKEATALYIKNFENSSEYAKRVQQVQEYTNLIQEKIAGNKITPETKIALDKEFDGPEAGFRARKAIIEGLKGNEITDKLGENATAVQQLRLKAAFEEANGKFENAYKLYEAILLMHEGDEQAKKELQRLSKLIPGIAAPAEKNDISPEEDFLIDSIIDEALNKSSMHEARTKTSIMEQMAEMLDHADRMENSTTSRRRRFSGDEAARDAEIDQDLQEYTGGKKMLNRKGTAEKKRVVNVEKLQHATSENTDLVNLKKFLGSKTQTENSKLESQDYVEFKDEKVGHLNGKMALTQAQQMELQTKLALTKIVEQMMAERLGGTLTPKQKMAIKKKIEKEDIGVKFQNTGSEG